MKKWKLLLGMIALSLGLLFSFSCANNVSASSWRRGAPRILRGTWKTHLYRNRGRIGIGWYFVRTTFYISNNSSDGLNSGYTHSKRHKGDGCGWGWNEKLHSRYVGNHHYRLVSYLGGRVKRSTRMSYDVYVRGRKAYIKQAAGRHLFYKVSNRTVG